MVCADLFFGDQDQNRSPRVEDLFFLRSGKNYSPRGEDLFFFRDQGNHWANDADLKVVTFFFKVEAHRAMVQQWWSTGRWAMQTFKKHKMGHGSEKVENHCPYPNPKPNPNSNPYQLTCYRYVKSKPKI